MGGCAILWILGCSGNADAQSFRSTSSSDTGDIGVGFAASRLPSLSVQYASKVAPNGFDASAYHLMLGRTDSSAEFSADYQLSYRPRILFWPPSRNAVYFGLGLGGETEKTEHFKEKYYVRAPLGVQIDLRAAPIQIFGEIAIRFGELPASNLSQSGAIGLRARF